MQIESNFVEDQTKTWQLHRLTSILYKDSPKYIPWRSSHHIPSQIINTSPKHRIFSSLIRNLSTLHLRSISISKSIYIYQYDLVHLLIIDSALFICYAILFYCIAFFFLFSFIPFNQVHKLFLSTQTPLNRSSLALSSSHSLLINCGDMNIYIYNWYYLFLLTAACIIYISIILAQIQIINAFKEI